MTRPGTSGGACPNDSHSFLGLKGQESTDHLECLFRNARPGMALPSWLKCPARRGQSRERQTGLMRCKNLFCPNCHDERQEELERRLSEIFLRATKRGAGELAPVVWTVPRGF
ncbi:MAG: hypothetical protein FD172_3943 [Methylocystaceae bacterium]|nr:MAG: hypothetical protein FD172_3943 [Methylocystaceae bacterium]